MRSRIAHNVSMSSAKIAHRSVQDVTSFIAIIVTGEVRIHGMRHVKSVVAN